MNCKNCKRNLNPGEKSCPYCGTKSEINDITKKTFINSVISLIIFSIILLITTFSMIIFYKDDSGAAGWIIIMLIFLTWMPTIVSIVLSYSASSSIKKYKKEGLNIPSKVKILGTINKFQIPIILFVFVIGFVFKDKKYDEFINQKLNHLYNSDYEIVNKCSRSNEGGDNYEIVVLKLKHFEYPIVSYFDWAHQNYKDNYDELKQADRLNYHSYINSIFDDTVITLMDFNNDERYKKVNLNILLTTNYLNNQNDLKLKVKQIINEYVSQFPDYDFSLSIYFTEKIDNTLIQEYYIYMSEIDDCRRDFELQVSSSIIETIHINIDENTNIDAEINNSFYSAY